MGWFRKNKRRGSVDVCEQIIALEVRCVMGWRPEGALEKKACKKAAQKVYWYLQRELRKEHKHLISVDRGKPDA